MIECENVWLQYNRHVRRGRSVLGALKDIFKPREETKPFWALQDIRFSVRKGDALGVIGPNGSGKSTLLKILGGILKPDRGRARTRGRIFPFLELGTGFEPELTGAENIFLNGSVLRIKKEDLRRRFDKIVEFAELQDVIETPIKHYSTGMQMRLGFAIAMHGDPDILLIDEVMAVGDQSFQKKCVQSIHEFKERGGTILFVSHAMDHVKQLCNVSLWLDHGVQRAFGESSGAVDAYLQDAHKKEMAALEANARKTVKKESAGTGEIEIREVVFLDENGNPSDSFKTRSRMSARIVFHARTRVRRPIFGVAIHHVDGAHICGPNTTACKEVLREVEGGGAVEFTVDSLLLLPGTYLFTVGIFDPVSHYPFDYRDKAYKFAVDFGGAEGHRGLVAMDYSWDLNPENKFQLEA